MVDRDKPTDPRAPDARRDERTSSANVQPRYRAVQLDGGRLLPIEVCIGPRVLRRIPIDSDEGQRLIASGTVEIVRPRDS